MKESTVDGRPQGFSLAFLLMAVLFNVCLIASNLFASKLFCVAGITLSGAVIIFPVSYILNDILCEVYGYRKARLVIWTGFAMNLFVVLVAQLVIALPGAPFWEGKEGFDLVFGSTPRALAASLLAFLAGSTMNAFVMSRMKLSDRRGRRFALRAVLSSVAGELLDSGIFVTILFWSLGGAEILRIVAAQVAVKVVYEIIILPLTQFIVRRVKAAEGVDTFDDGISYNPFKITDF